MVQLKYEKGDDFMDKSTIEKYLRIYTSCIDEMSKLETEISNLESTKKKYESKIDDRSRSMIETLDAAIVSAKKDLEETTLAYITVTKMCSSLNQKEKKILELRFWNNQHFLTKWNEVAEKLGCDRCHVERIYKNIIQNALVC
jgi:DNA-directed RNA polymerase specialized sigma subunit